MSKANQARDNRLLMPECSRFIDGVRAASAAAGVEPSGIKVVYAEENGIVLDGRAAADAHRKAEIEARK